MREIEKVMKELNFCSKNNRLSSDVGAKEEETADYCLRIYYQSSVAFLGMFLLPGRHTGK